MLNVLHINGQYPNIEAQIFKTWQLFCLKSPPLPELEGKTLSQRIEHIHYYWQENFRDNLIFYEGNVERFALYGFGTKWLNAPNEEKAQLNGQKTAILIMGASLNKSFSGAFFSLKCLRETFSILKKDYGIETIAWNVSREYKKKPFEKLMSKVGKNLGNYWISR